MFKDFNYLVDFDTETHTANYCIIAIIDDDFEEKIKIKMYRKKGTMGGGIINLITALVQVYSEKQLNVVDNLTIFLLKWQSDYNFSMNDMIEYLDEHSVEFKTYSNQVKQLLLFS